MMSKEYQAPSGAEHPITPPPVLVSILASKAEAAEMPEQLYIATQAARWGADQELEACCAWLKDKEWIHPEFSDELRAARRPKPPSLKKQALEALDALPTPTGQVTADRFNTIRRALEQLDD